MDHDTFRHFWWLIFPIFWMGMGMMSMWQKHVRANHTIDLIKSYVDQGKEPPAALLEALRDPDDARSKKPGNYWISVCLFAALSAGFVLFALLPGEWEPKQKMAFFFVAIVMGGMSLGFLVAALTQRNDRGRNLPR